MICSSSLFQRYWADHMYEQPRRRDSICMDTFFGHHKSLDGNKYAQIFANELFFALSYPMDLKKHTGQVLKQFRSDFGVPVRLVLNGAKEHVMPGIEYVKTV